jgi:serine phosphatase RsbU (regulator of sigma subunit)
LNRSVNEFGLTDPGKILDKTRELVLETFSRSDEDVKDGMDISIASINKAGNVIKWSGANNPLWYISKGELKEITAHKQAIGKTDDSKPFPTHEINLNKGDSVFLFTDGFADQFGGEKQKKFKYKPLKELLLKNVMLSQQEQKEKLDFAFNNWKGVLEQVDDVCIIGLKL